MAYNGTLRRIRMSEPKNPEPVKALTEQELAKEFDALVKLQRLMQLEAVWREKAAALPPVVGPKRQEP
jgi:hypothetical protein